MVKNDTEGADYFLDITSDVCPLTFVKTKLLIERMSSGQTAEIRLNAGEPLENVPRAVEEHGHAVLALEPEATGATVHRLRLRKA
ncbi:MAG: sulfurtransferase TusA family protein [Alphaproteobacteria bacterium]